MRVRRKRSGSRLRWEYVIVAVIFALLAVYLFHSWRKKEREEEEVRDEFDDYLIGEAMSRGETDLAQELKDARDDDKTHSTAELASIVISGIIAAAILGIVAGPIFGAGGALVAAGMGALGGAGGAYLVKEELEDNRRTKAELAIKRLLEGGHKPKD